MDLHRIASRIANTFSVKMDTNAFVINEIAHMVDPSASGASLSSLQNGVAASILESDIHDLISKLSISISAEADKLRKSQKAA